MPETTTVQGEIRILGLVHQGTAINAMIVPYADPESWEMKQFVSDSHLQDYARSQNLLIVSKES